jgi:hypothetical protein
MVNVDPSNNNAPETNSNSNTASYTTAYRTFAIQGYKPGNNAVAMVANTGNIYLLLAPTGNKTGNKSDTGCMVKVIAPGAEYFLPIDPTGQMAHSIYRYFIDSDSGNDGGLVVAYQGLNP